MSLQLRWAKKRWGYCNRLRPSIHLTLGEIQPNLMCKLLTWMRCAQYFNYSEIQLNLVCELLTWMARPTALFFGSMTPGAIRRGKNFRYHLISITKSISKIFKSNFVSSHKWKIYNISDGIFIRSPGSCPRVGTWGTGRGGVKQLFFPKFNQIWFLSYSHELHVQRHNVFGPCPLLPWGGTKDLISLNFSYKVNSKDF